MSELRTISIQSKPVLCNVTEASGLNIDISVTATIKIDYVVSDEELYQKKITDSDEAFDLTVNKHTSSALQVAVLTINSKGISYETLRNSSAELSEKISERLKDTLLIMCGIEIKNIVVSDIKANDSDEQKFSSFAKAGGAPSNPAFAADALLAKMQSEMKNATPVPTSSEPKIASAWICSCGETSSGNFCPTCGKKRPQAPEEGWICINCRTNNNGRFCSNCGHPFTV